jgi:uncharacterized protein (TIGR00255 family)
MNSMTGFGRGSGNGGGRAVTVQVDSVNRRGLDVTVALPDGWDVLEAPVVEAVRRAVLRGKVHVAVEAAGAAEERRWDEDAVGRELDRLRRLADARGVAFQPDARLLWEVARSVGGGGAGSGAEEAWPALERALAEALRGLAAMRAREGEALLVDFLGRLEKVHGHVEAVAARAPLVAPAYREQLLQRLRAAGLELDPADERVLKEIALFADRADVTEEITRLRSHLAQLRDLLRADGEVGRKADFLLQEIGREVNTIGSKANDLAISQRVIECKNELERIREQMANVE